MKNKNKYIFLLLALALIIGFYLRIRCLDVKIFWFDEFFTEERCFYTFNEIWTNYKTQRVLFFSLIMKIYSLLILYINKAKFMTEIQLRLPNVILGSAVIVVIYYIGKRIKNDIFGIISALICSFSYYLILYSREARYYPLYFLISSLLICYGILIIREKYTYKYYFFYSLFASIGMYTHTGFWLLYAISNVYIVLFDLLNLFQSNISFKVKIKRFALHIIILASPIFLASPLFFHLLRPDSNRPIMDKTRMLECFNFETLNEFSCSFWANFPFEKWMFSIVSIMVILLSLYFIFFSKKKTREIGTLIYLCCIKILPFVIAVFLPRNLIKEALISKYIIFVLCADIFILSLFFATFIHLFSFLISRKTIISYNVFTIILVSAFYVTLVIYYFPKLLKSDLYQPYKYLQSYVDALKKYYKSNFFLLTDDLELGWFLKHSTIAGTFPKNSYCEIYRFSENFKLPKQINGLMLLTTGEIKFYNGVQLLASLGTGNPILGSKGTGKLLFVKTDLSPSPQTLMALTQKIISNTPNYSYVNHNEKLRLWRRQYNNISVDDILVSNNNFTNLIKNGDFSSGLDYWTSNSKHFLVNSEKNYNYLCLDNNTDRGWKQLVQYFYVNSGDVINVSYEARLSNRSKENENIFVVFSYVGKDKSFYNEKYYTLNVRNLKNEWITFQNLLQMNEDKKVSIRVQYKNNGVADIKKISCFLLQRCEEDNMH